MKKVVIHNEIKIDLNKIFKLILYSKNFKMEQLSEEVSKINIEKETKQLDIWRHIIEYNKIDLSKQISLITAKQIEACSKSWKGKSNKFEARLLCKMDNSNSRPDIFKKNNISLLSIKNGTYALIKENIYIQLQTFYCVPNKIHNNNNSMLLEIGNSETNMLDKMLYNGILSDIIGEKIIYGPILGGRHRCRFDTLIGEEILNINGSQYETDGCYETDNYVCIVEAKSKICEDFNIRQLYYPFREVHKKVGTKKQIIALFIYKDKWNIIHVHKFKWNDYEKMLDIINIGYFEYRE